MTYTFWQFAFAIQAFTFAHLLSTFFYLIQIVLHFFHPANRIRSHRITCRIVFEKQSSTSAPSAGQIENAP